ncbi:HigA family addiction module antitoxin [Phytoactinopolyspora endophytica]|uniref:HigA family addiction module antitoxin n=1 Tax=Phytoactinopolyspora endophytica TaxID=1642495 RepID=UPI00101C8D3E|nr:HigA family addiction module antitoxin [Phytoactinopolyspora endophytica]
MTTRNPVPAEVFPVSEYLRDELEARGWTGAEFAQIIGRPSQVVSEILNDRKEITAETATEIAAATGTTPETWLRLQDAYRLWKLGNEPATAKLTDVQRRAKLRSLVPVNELVKRGEVPATGLDEQEQAIRALLGISALEETPRFAIAARRSDRGEPLSPPQVAWLALVHRRASQRSAAAFSYDALVKLSAGLTESITSPGDLRLVPLRIEETGVRVVYVPPFRSSKIDGAAFVDDHGPVIGLSGRIDRLDSVLFTLLHEIAHLVLGHVNEGFVIDIDLGAEGEHACEREADQQAAQWCLPTPPSITPPYSRGSVIAEADRIGVHPAVLIGHLQHSGKLPWSHLNNLIPKVRNELSAWPM